MFNQDQISNYHKDGYLSGIPILNEVEAGDYREQFDALEKRLEPTSIPACVLVIADFQYKGAFAMDSEINFVACLTEIMSECKFKDG